MRLTLSVISGPHRGLSFSFARHDTFLVGRSKHAHFQLPQKDKYFSRIHFMMEVNPPQCRLIDMGSHNGTYVNGQRVLSADLKDGDRIRAGHTELTLTLHPEPHDDRPGSPAESEPPVVPGYMVERTIGTGSLGTLYQATRLADITPVALKLIRPRGTAGPEQTQRFLAQVQALHGLHHPHIVPLRDAGTVQDWIYIVSDYVPAGLDAIRIVQRELRLDVGRALRWMDQLLDGLEYAHAQGRVHRDIKPRNVLVSSGAAEEHVRWTDYGLAGAYSDSPLSGLTLTGHDQIAAFLAPELLLDFHQARPAADQYSAAALCYYFLTGCHIFDLPPELHRQFSIIMKQAIVPIQQRRVDVPDRLAQALTKALGRRPQQRFPSIAAFRQALRQCGPA